MAGNDGRGSDAAPGDRAPGDEGGGRDAVVSGIPGYTIGLALAGLLTAASFVAAGSSGIVWAPGVPVVLIVLAIAQMGVHIVFFMHVTTGPDSLNNAMALAFGTLIVLLLLSGTLWIMYHLDLNMMDMTTNHMSPNTMPMQH